MRKYILIALLLSYCAAYGQVSTMEKPISFRTSISLRQTEKSIKSFAPLDLSKIKQEDKEDEAKGIPPRFGYKRKVDYNLDNSGEWATLPNGDKIWRLVISCSGALSINLLYDKFWIPDGAKFFVYSNDRKHSIGAFTAANNKGTKDDVQGFATGLVYGDQVTLEYYLPSSVKEVGVISVAYVIHGYRYIPLAENMESGLGQSGSCQVNVNCIEGQNWQNEKNAVAMILVNGYRYCTGSLMNTTANDYRPLFLTADHCLGGWANNDVKHDAISNSNLSHWSFYWHYEASGCANTSPVIRSTVGATLVANNGISDFALLRLAENPRSVSGLTLHYLGWDRSGNTGVGGVGIHHPAGDVKKIATHNQTPQSSGNYWRLYWMQTPNGYSVTEGGSSGSALINSSRHVIGQLYGGSNVNCSNPARDYALYGKFNVSWTGNNATDSRRRLRDWLDPNNTGVSVLDACAQTITFANQTVTTNQTVAPNCGDISVQNVTVTNGAKLTLDAANEVTITSGFEVTYGSELEIK